MEDVKAVPADFEIGDFSERTEPLGPFCVWHGYFGECPECQGSVERWTFTVVQADDHALVIDEAWTQRQALPGEWSGSSPAQAPIPRGLNRQQRDSENAAPDHTPIRVNPGLLARIRLLLEERA
jgi:hypothetical protein